MVSRPLRTDLATLSDIGSECLKASGVISLEQETIFRFSMRLSVMGLPVVQRVHQRAILRENFGYAAIEMRIFHAGREALDKCLSGARFSRGQGIIVDSIIRKDEGLP